MMSSGTPEGGWLNMLLEVSEEGSRALVSFETLIGIIPSFRALNIFPPTMSCGRHPERW